MDKTITVGANTADMLDLLCHEAGMTVARLVQEMTFERYATRILGTGLATVALRPSVVEPEEHATRS